MGTASHHRRQGSPEPRLSASTRTALKTTAAVGVEADVGEDVFGYIAPPGTITPHRDVLRWVQSLDLAHSLKDCRRDLASGFYVAQIFSRYFPDKVQMHSFENGNSMSTKKDNWWQIQRFCKRWRGKPLPDDLVEDTILGVHAAGVLLLHLLYETFTGKKVPQRPPTPEPEPGEEVEEPPKRRPIAPVIKKAGRPVLEIDAKDDGKPKNYGIMGSKPVTRQANVSKTGVEFSKAGKIQLGEVTDMQELRRKLQGL